jgi:hypothetical protein
MCAIGLINHCSFHHCRLCALSGHKFEEILRDIPWTNKNENTRYWTSYESPKGVVLPTPANPLPLQMNTKNNSNE